MKTKTQTIFDCTAPYDNACQGAYPRALFVCSAGMLRSATAAVIGAKLGLNTRACGSENYALIPLSTNLILWAQKIYFVNEYNYRSALETFQDDECLLMDIKYKAVVWDIEDIYNYMDPKLQETITDLLTWPLADKEL